MSKCYAQWGSDFVVYGVTWSDRIIAGEGVAECEGDGVIGKIRRGDSFVDAPKILRYRVWGKPEFIFMLGVDVYKAINSGANDELAFYKYILENSPHVDLNVKEFRDMVTALNVAGLVDAEKLAAILVQE